MLGILGFDENAMIRSLRYVEPVSSFRTKVAINDRTAYALGWIIAQAPNGNIVWHNGRTNGFGSYVGLELDRHIVVIVLTNQSNVGFPDAIGAWTFDQLLGNSPVDHVAEALKRLSKGRTWWRTAESAVLFDLSAGAGRTLRVTSRIAC